MKLKTKEKEKRNTVYDVFTKFCNDRIKEAKLSDRDMLNEVYANTELFDFSDLRNMTDTVRNNLMKSGTDIHCKSSKNQHIFNFTITLPFESCFLYTTNDGGMNFSLFIREYDVSDIVTLTGTLGYSQKVSGMDICMNAPFTLRVFDTSMSLVFSDIKVGERLIDNYELNKLLIGNLMWFIYLLGNLSNLSIVEDHTGKNDYYTFKDKNKPTIKVPNRVIYYVMDKKTYKNKSYKINSIGKLQYSHSFMVRGHWRRIDSESIGKDRRGQKIVQGKTFVRDYIKGTGELVKKIRIVK